MKRRSVEKRRLSIQVLETRRVLAASLGWDGPGLGDATLTYNIANSPSSLSQGEVNAAVETALGAWSAVADITFVPTSQSGLRDSLDISFENIDGPGGTLAQAYLPDDVNPARIAGDIEFDLSENWEVGNSLGRSAFDLVWVAAHEIGHALGLDHINVAESVLVPFVSPNVQFAALSQTDVDAIGQLYAAADDTGVTVDVEEDTSVDDTSDDPTTDTPADDNTRNERRFRRWSWRRWGRSAERLEADVSEHHNLYNATDVNGDNNTSAADALMIINQLSQAFDTVEFESIVGMCDTNADGDISAADALFVINSLSQADQVDDAGEIDALDPGEDEDEDSEAMTDDVTIVVDTADPNESADEDDDDGGVDDTTDPDDDTADPDPDDTEGEVDEEEDDETDNEDDDTDDEEDEIDDEDDELDEVDDQIDEVDDSLDDETDDEEDETDDDLDDDGSDESDEDGIDEDEEDDDDCPDGHGMRHGGRHRFGFGRDVESLFAMFDDNEDGSITEDEVPEFIWEKVIDRNVDANGDNAITLQEIETAMAAARAEKFAELDSSSDGLIQEDEVSARKWERIMQADTDGDNAVSIDELDTWISERKMDDEPEPEPVDQLFRQFGRAGNLRFGPRF